MQIWIPFWILTYHRTTVHALPGYPPPPSPRVRCHLACVYLLTTLLDFDDTNESQSGPIKNYPPGRRADREVSSYRRTRRALSPRSRAYPADRPRVRSIGLIGQRTTAKRCLCPIMRSNVIRNVPAFRRRQPAFIGKYESLLLVTAGLPRDQSYLGTHARYAPKGSAYLPRDGLSDGRVKGTRTYRWCSRDLSETINWRPYRRYGTRSPGLHYRVFL